MGTSSFYCNILVKYLCLFLALLIHFIVVFGPISLIDVVVLTFSRWQFFGLDQNLSPQIFR